MFLADCHTHSSCSFDGHIPMVEMAKTAYEYGLSNLTLTDHADFLDLDGCFTPFYDWEPLDRQRGTMLRAFGTKLDLPMGIEFGMGFLEPEAARNILSHPGLDFVIGSVHNQSREKGGGDFYFLPYETTEDCYRALDDYFDSMLQLARGEFYDVVGHIIYPLRYMEGDFAPPTLSRYWDTIREIMRLAIESGRGIEINTWKGNTLKEWIPLLKLYKELHGEIITVGSDAHATAPIGRGVKTAYTMMQDCGFRYVAAYHERRPEMIRLK